MPGNEWDCQDLARFDRLETCDTLGPVWQRKVYLMSIREIRGLPFYLFHLQIAACSFAKVYSIAIHKMHSRDRFGSRKQCSHIHLDGTLVIAGSLLHTHAADFTAYTLQQ